MVYVSEKLRHSGDEAPRGVNFLPSDKNNLFLQAHKKYAVFFLLLCTPRGRFQAQRACFSLFKADFRGFANPRDGTRTFFPADLSFFP